MQGSVFLFSEDNYPPKKHRTSRRRSAVTVTTTLSLPVEDRPHRILSVGDKRICIHSVGDTERAQWRT